MTDIQDNVEIEVRANAVLPPAASTTAAEAAATNRTELVSLIGARQIDCFINFSVVDAASTEFYIRFRFSGKAAPSIATPSDWAYIKVDNIDTATGISEVQDYEIKFTPTLGQSVLRITQTSGIWVSAVLFVNQGATTECSVSFMRQGGT